MAHANNWWGQTNSAPLTLRKTKRYFKESICCWSAQKIPDSWPWHTRVFWKDICPPSDLKKCLLGRPSKCEQWGAVRVGNLSFQSISKVFSLALFPHFQGIAFKMYSTQIHISRLWCRGSTYHTETEAPQVLLSLALHPPWDILMPREEREMDHFSDRDKKVWESLSPHATFSWWWAYCTLA